MDEMEPPAGDDGFAAQSLSDIRRPLELFGRFMSTAAVLFLVAYVAATIFVLTSGYLEGESRQVDFVAFWSAAKLALTGDLTAPFDQGLLRSVQGLPPDADPGELFWLYPPGLLLLLAPLGLIPYWAAWVIFLLLSIIAFASALWRTARPVPMGQNLVLGAPPVVGAMMLGQLILLWSAALVVALRAIEQARPITAGLLIALLTLKPQLGILVPVALVAAGQWKVILWACIGMVPVHAVPTLVAGVEYWGLFFERMSDVARALELGLMQHQLMVSPYALFRFLELSHKTALFGQLALTLSMAVCIAFLWRRRWGTSDFRAGMLVVAIPIATPYAYYYELTLTIPAIILLVRGGYGRQVLDRMLLAILILSPLVLFPVTELSPLFAALNVAIFARCLTRANDFVARPD